MSGSQSNQSSTGEGIDQTDANIGKGVTGHVICLNCFTDFTVVDVKVGSETSCFYCGTVHVVNSINPLDIKLKGDVDDKSMLAQYGEYLS